MTKKVWAYVPSDEDKKRLNHVTQEVIDLIYSHTTEPVEVCFILKILVESYQKSANVIIPIEANGTT